MSGLLPKPIFVTLSKAKGLSRYCKKEILHFVQNDNQAQNAVWATRPEDATPIAINAYQKNSRGILPRLSDGLCA
jgi:hypothetical protein